MKSQARILPSDATAAALGHAAEALKDPAPSNDDPSKQPTFFRHLEGGRHALGICGNKWGEGRLSIGEAYLMADVERCIYGLGGVLDVLHANSVALIEQDSIGEHVPHIGAHVTDRLHYAAGMLLARAESAMDRLRDDLEKRK